MAILPNSVLQSVMVTGNPSASANPDNQVANVMGGRHGDMLISRIHGEGFIGRARGIGFVGSSGAAGIAALAAPAGTGGAGSFVLFNPPGSGVLLELERIHLTAPTSTQTQIVAGFGLEGSLQTPSGTLTQATVSTFPLGAGGTAKAKVYAAATISAMTWICGLGITTIATTSVGQIGQVDFGGKMVLAPGFSVNVCSTLVQTAEHIIVDYFWSEWPV